MTTAEARQLVQKTFQNPFDKGQFVYFIKNLVNKIDEEKAFHARGYVHEKYRDRVKTYERIGTYTDPEDNKIDILIVYLQKESSIDRARTTLRNFVGDYLKERGEKEAGLIAFVSPNEKDWRFSLVKMEYKITETPSGRVKAKEEFTPAKRYSFLVGVEETSHTAQSRLVPILEEDKQNPTLKQIEEAFNIEKVTKEFFEKYRDLYLRVKETLDEVLKNDKAIKADFAGKNIDTVDFGKKLLGQIVFLYFLQKKGWFGVKRDEAWGSGSKNFLRELFDRKHGDYKNFFNDTLEPLFYEALRNDRSHDDHYFSMFKCKIPFLNGGLFDPINNYDWKETDIILPNDLFSNSYKTKDGDIGTGILDIFDRYNFTVKEDEPLEKEVAVDPEMLGKVFENLLEVKDRKSKGTYYTPREIVHYMCQESLVNYLATELDKKVNKKDVETLIKYGETAIEHDATSVEKKSKDPKYKSSYYKLKLPKSIERRAKLIDEKLETIRICDPAVGSGAFPVGMMNEIIRTRNALTSYLKAKKGRTIYDFKRHAIQNCLYGVDIDLGAVEIAKLRLWLSLIVDEEDIKQIKPLPNLDYKIVQGNSLSSVQKDLFNQQLFTKLEELKPLFFNETNASKKKEYKNQIDELIRKITNNNQNFDFEIYFSEVFHEKKGFDVVIANPPYITYKGKQKVNVDKGEIEFYQKVFVNSAEYKINSFALFLEKGAKLLSKSGILTYIIPSTFLQNEYLGKIRKHLLSNFHITKIITFGNKVFEAITDSIIVFITNSYSESKKETLAIRKNDLDFSQYDKPLSFEQSKWLKLNDGVINLKSTTEDNVVISKIEKDSMPLGNFLSIYVGIVAHGIKKFLSKEKLNSQYKKYLQGKHISRYRINPVELYVNFDINNLHSNTDESVYLQPQKLLIRKTGSTLIAAYDDAQFYTDQSIYNLYPKQSNELNLKYILALLNSSLMNFYFRKKMITNPDVFPYIKGIHLSKLPLKKMSADNQKPLLGLAEKILTITKDDDYLGSPTKQNKVRDYEKQIDQLVYKLYGLTPEEIKIVENRT